MRSALYSFVLLALLPIFGAAQSGSMELLDSAKRLGLISWSKEAMLRSALKSLDGLAPKSLRTEVNREFGHFFFYTGWYDSALVYFQKNMPLFEKNSLELAACFNNQAAAFQGLGRYRDATDRYLSAQRIFEFLDDQAGLAKVFNNLSVLNQKNGG